MASGFGSRGSVGRCYSFWTDFSRCLASAETPSDCKLQREDYFECLHHKKEFTALNAQASGAPAEAPPAASTDDSGGGH